MGEVQGRFLHPNPATIPHPPFTPTPQKIKTPQLFFMKTWGICFLSWDIWVLKWQNPNATRRLN